MINLIINADDFGLSKVFNESILDLLERREITSTTVMVNRITQNQRKQVDRLKELIWKGDVSVGLHTELTYDDYLGQVNDQFMKFMRLFGCEPTHIDIHKEHLYTRHHEHIANFCKHVKVPFRNHGNPFPNVTMPAAEYFYGSIPEFADIGQWISTLEDGKTYELVFHPGTFDPDCASSLNKDREIDLRHIKKVNQNIQNFGIELVDYNSLSVKKSAGMDS